MGTSSPFPIQSTSCAAPSAQPTGRSADSAGDESSTGFEAILAFVAGSNLSSQTGGSPPTPESEVGEEKPFDVLKTSSQSWQGAPQGEAPHADESQGLGGLSQLSQGGSSGENASPESKDTVSQSPRASAKHPELSGILIQALQSLVGGAAQNLQAAVPSSGTPPASDGSEPQDSKDTETPLSRGSANPAGLAMQLLVNSARSDNRTAATLPSAANLLTGQAPTNEEKPEAQTTAELLTAAAPMTQKAVIEKAEKLENRPIGNPITVDGRHALSISDNTVLGKRDNQTAASPVPVQPQLMKGFQESHSPVPSGKAPDPQVLPSELIPESKNPDQSVGDRLTSAVKGVTRQDSQGNNGQPPFPDFSGQENPTKPEEQAVRRNDSSSLAQDFLKEIQQAPEREAVRGREPNLNISAPQDAANPPGEGLGHRTQSSQTSMPEIPVRSQTPPPPVLSQIVERMAYHLTRGDGRMELDLKPDSLGRLHVEIISDDRGIQAKFVAETSAVREVIQTHMDRLRSALESQGLKVDQLFVQVGENPWGQTRHGMPAFQDPENAAGFGEEGVDVSGIGGKDSRWRNNAAFSDPRVVDLFV